MQLQSPSGQRSDPGFQRLLSRIRSKYAVCEETVAIGDREYDFTRVLDPDHVLEAFELAAEREDGTQPLWQPYWAEAWESAVVLANALTSRDLSEHAVLDLGCGLGLVGTVAASLGAKVLMVDAAPPALLFAKLNSWSWRDRVAVQQLDWRCDKLRQRFSLIAGSDIVYDRDEWPYLETFWRRHLHDDGSVLLAEPGRSTGDEFIAWIGEREWRLRELEHKREDSKRVRVLEIRRT
jgi:predicted nicotinamide N-methyase